MNCNVIKDLMPLYADDMLSSSYSSFLRRIANGFKRQ